MENPGPNHQRATPRSIVPAKREFLCTFHLHRKEVCHADALRALTASVRMVYVRLVSRDVVSLSLRFACAITNVDFLLTTAGHDYALVRFCGSVFIFRRRNTYSALAGARSSPERREAGTARSRGRGPVAANDSGHDAVRESCGSSKRERLYPNM